MKTKILLFLLCLASLSAKAQLSAQDIVFKNNTYSVVIPVDGYSGAELNERLYYAICKTYCKRFDNEPTTFLGETNGVMPFALSHYGKSGYFYLSEDENIFYTCIAQSKEGKIRIEFVFNFFAKIEDADWVRDYSFDNFSRTKPQYLTNIKTMLAKYINDLIANVKSHNDNW